MTTCCRYSPIWACRICNFALVRFPRMSPWILPGSCAFACIRADLDGMLHHATVSPSVVESQTTGECHQVYSESEHPDASGRHSRPCRPLSLALAGPRPGYASPPGGKVGALPDTIVSSDTFVQ